mgnify:FL=1
MIGLAAVLDTHSHGDHLSSAQALREALPSLMEAGGFEALGWPVSAQSIQLGAHWLVRLPIPGHTQDSHAYLLNNAQGLQMAFVGDTVMPGSLGRSDFEQSAPLDFGGSLRALEQAAGPHTLLLAGHDYDNRFATTLAVECAAQPLLAAVLRGSQSDESFAVEKAALESVLAPTEYQTLACGARVESSLFDDQVEMSAADVRVLLRAARASVLVDVREPFEARMGAAATLDAQVVPLSTLVNALPGWMHLPAETPLIFVCRSGNRSAQAARALRRLGHAQAWSLSGGLALWPAQAGDVPGAAALAI